MLTEGKVEYCLRIGSEIESDRAAKVEIDERHPMGCWSLLLLHV